MVESVSDPGAPDVTVERHIALESALNFRDIGGYRTADGRRVRWRRVFRSGGLSELSSADLDVLRQLGIATVLDLRSTTEWTSGHFPVHEIPVSIHHLPIIEEVLDPSRYPVTQGMLGLRYQEFATSGAPNIAQALSIVADTQTHPVIIHCLAGKDRTGVVVALLLSLLGVDDETVAQDYSLSNLAMARLRAQAEANRDLLVRTQMLSDEVFSARPSNIAVLFDALRSTHGSIENFVVSAGTTSDTIEALRDALLE